MEFMQNRKKIFRKFSMVLENNIMPLKNLKNNTFNYSLTQKNFANLPLIKLQKDSPKFMSLNKSHKQVNSLQIYHEILEKKSKFMVFMEKTSLNNLCQLQKKNKNNEKVKKKSKDSLFLNNLINTNKNHSQIPKKTTIKLFPARFLPNSHLQKTKSSRFSSLDNANSVASPLKTESSALFLKPPKKNPSKIQLQILLNSKSSGKKDVFELTNKEPLTTKQNEKIDDPIKIEDTVLCSKKYLEIAGDLKVNKHISFAQVIRSLLESLNLIFEMKLNLKDVNKNFMRIIIFFRFERKKFLVQNLFKSLAHMS